MKILIGLLQVACVAYWFYRPETGLVMAGPLAIPIMLVASAAFQGFASYRQAQGQEAIAEFNAKVSQQEADAKEKQAGIAAEQFRKEGVALQATQKTQYGRAGVLAGTGSPTTVRAETAKELELDRQMILAGGTAEGERFRNQAIGQRLQADSFKSQGRSALLGSVLSGLSSAASYRSLTAKPKA